MSMDVIPVIVNIEMKVLLINLTMHSQTTRNCALVCLRCGRTVGRLLRRCTVTWLPNFLGWVDSLSYGAPQARPWSSVITAIATKINNEEVDVHWQFLFNLNLILAGGYTATKFNIFHLGYFPIYLSYRSCKFVFFLSVASYRVYNHYNAQATMYIRVFICNLRGLKHGYIKPGS